VNDIYLVLVGRALLGLAVAGIITSITTMIADFFEGQERQRFLGMQAAIHSLCGVVFVGAGGFLADVSWRMPFVLYFLSLVMLPLAWILIEERDVEHLVSTDTSSPETTDRRKIMFILFTMVMAMVAFYMVPVQLPFYMMEKLQVKNSLVGIAIGVATITGASTASFYRRIKNVLSYESIMAIGMLFLATGYGFVSFVQEYDGILTGLAITGLGLGLLLPNINLWLMDSAPVLHRGKLVGALTSASFGGQFLSPIFTEPLVNHFSLRDAFWFVSLFMAGFALVFLTIALRRKRRFAAAEVV